MDSNKSNSGDNGRRKPSRPKEYDYFIKVVIIGSSAVGKSSLMIRFTDEKFSESYVNTIGVDFRFKTLNIDGKKVKIQIWDTAGQEKFRTITSTYYRGADAVLLVYDITNQLSFDDLKEYWFQEVENNAPDVSFLIMIGNKKDMENKRKVPEIDPPVYQIKTGKMSRQAQTFEVSAKNDDGVTGIFNGLAIEFIKKKEAKRAGKSFAHGNMKIVPLTEIKELEDEESGSRSSSSDRRKEDKVKSQPVRLLKQSAQGGLQKKDSESSECLC